MAAFEAIQNGKMPDNNFPPTLLTYLFWINEKEDRVRCRLDLEYSNQKGFEITEMHIERREFFWGITDEIEIGVYAESRVPTSLEAIRTVMSGQEMTLISMSGPEETPDPVHQEYIRESTNRNNRETSLDGGNQKQKNGTVTAISDGEKLDKVAQAQKRKKRLGL